MISTKNKNYDRRKKKEMIQKYITQALQLFCNKYGYELTNIEFIKIKKNESKSKHLKRKKL